MLVFQERGKPEFQQKNLQEQSREPTNSATYDAGSGNQTRDTLVRGEYSHHCATPAPQIHVYSYICCPDLLSSCKFMFSLSLMGEFLLKQLLLSLLVSLAFQFWPFSILLLQSSRFESFEVIMNIHSQVTPKTE